ncbi:hypothetical protein GWG54_02845 [Natronococcus sp. JC468]|uniref:DUF7545 family protein n=1 Tax=Natronococcus sp. JC468 TaxID=1961921 RepID=UPI00143C2810|nr:hypothetical protein [Natronococcus sp. JC468]NKE34767.1 hypothetical protein [Natronococcus sp. JC468]
MTDDVDTITLTISTDDGATDEVTLPAGLVDLLAEGDQDSAETVGDIALLSFASRAHHFVHHGEGTDPELEAQEERIMELFEERFGQTFAEATGHQH